MILHLFSNYFYKGDPKYFIIYLNFFLWERLYDIHSPSKYPNWNFNCFLEIMVLNFVFNNTW